MTPTSSTSRASCGHRSGPACGAAAAVTGCSAFTLADAEDRFGLEPGRGQVIPNGVDLGEGPAPTPPPNGHADGSASNGRNGSTASVGSVFATEAGRPDRPYVLALGRVVEKKGFDLLLAAYAAIDEAHRSADLVIGGQGEALEDLRRTAVGARHRRPGPLRRSAVPREGGRGHGRGDDVRHAQSDRTVRDRDPRSLAGRYPGGGHRSGRASASSSATAMTACWSTRSTPPRSPMPSRTSCSIPSGDGASARPGGSGSGSSDGRPSPSSTARSTRRQSRPRSGRAASGGGSRPQEAGSVR